MSNNDATKSRIYLFDRFIIGYCLLLVVACLLIGRPLNEYYGEIIAYLSIAGLAALIVRYVDESRGRFSMFLRIMYPILLFAPLYTLTGGTMTLLFDSFYDAQLTDIEKLLYGYNATIYIDQHLLTGWFNEILSFCYIAYYAMVPGFFIPAFVMKDYEIIKRTLSGITLTYFVSYLLFVIYPIEGPRWFFANLYANDIEGYLFRDMVEWVIGNGAVHGGAMPSSHTGVALAVMIYSFKYYRPFGWIMMPVVIGLAMGTVFGRFHYITDVFVGAAIALGALWFSDKVYDRWTKPKYNTRESEMLKAEHVT